MLTPEQQSSAIAGPCSALAFLIEIENRHVARNQMKGISDPAIFHRWMTLGWTFGEAEAIALLTPEERTLLDDFNAVYESIPWVPMDTHPFICDTTENELNRLIPVGTKLLQSLRLRSQRKC